MLNRARKLVLGALALAVLGCSPPAEDEEETEAPGRGTAACREWQDALCDWAADQCDGMGRGTCDRQAQAVACTSDAEAEACTAVLRDSSCDDPATDCGVLAMADREPAVEACEEYAEVVCAAEERCGMAVASVCTAGMIDQLRCADAYGVALDYDACIYRLEIRGCTDDFPAICDTVLLVEE
jgi:hypothetical protein